MSVESPTAACDFRRYKTSDGFNLNALDHDLGRYGLEADNTKLDYQRAVFYSLTKLGDEVFDFRTDEGEEPISNHFRFDTLLNIQESTAGLEIGHMILDDEPVGTLAVWISPSGGPGKYPEGRIGVHLKRDDIGFKFTESYGIIADGHPDAYKFIAYKLAEHAEGSYSFSTAEDLRGIVFILRPIANKNPWDRMAELIPDKETWAAIKSGQAIEQTFEAERHAREVRNVILPQLLEAKTDQDFLHVGASAERHMAQKGYVVSSEPCGPTNSDLLLQTVSTLQSGMIITADGEILYYVKKCPYCNREIEKAIPKGFRCDCGEEFTAKCT